MLIELGEELRKARETQGQSLQTVVEPAKISTAYLQKLERGTVITPSPHVLRRLAIVLKIPYLRLMALAGYLTKEESTEAVESESSPRPHPLANQKLSQEEWHAVGAFINVLKNQRT
jgi:transcriptional regulator with XRE-family HTH domain